MDVRNIITSLVENEDYDLIPHCLEEMDKDGMSIQQIEDVLLNGNIAKIEKHGHNRTRYTLKWRHIMCCIELFKSGYDYYMDIVTAGRERR